MNELTQERSHTNAGIVKNALANHQLASDMNELTQERSRILVNIVVNALAGYQLARNMNEDMLESVSLINAFSLRTFARNFSNIDFFLKILPLKDDELVMSEM